MDLQIQIVLKLLIDILVFRNILNISNHNNAWSFFKMALSKIKENKQKTLKLFFPAEEVCRKARLFLDILEQDLAGSSHAWI